MVRSPTPNNPPKHPNKRHNNEHLLAGLRPNNASTPQRSLLNNNANQNLPSLRLDHKFIYLLLNEGQ